MNKHILFLTVVILSIIACSPSVPNEAEPQHVRMPVFPDNDGAALPPNIAPIGFRILTDGDDYVTHFYNNRDDELVVGGRDVIPDVDDWHNLLALTLSDTLYTDVYVKRDGHWLCYPAQRNYIAPDSIDQYLSYRLIPPSYISYEDITINQRDLTNFNTYIIYDNRPLTEGEKGQCVNCHSYQDWNRMGRMQLHLRENHGGTVIVDGDKAVKVTLKTDSMRSAGVYPAWHPIENLIAYSVNSTGQVFHTRDTQKVEVIDYGSDLILFDPSHNTAYTICNDSNEMETFPAWSPDGRTLYYCSAHYVQQTDNIDAELDSGYQSLHYNIYSRSFDPKTLHFGSPQLVVDAAGGLPISNEDSTLTRKPQSATMPRLSPDGCYLLFTLGDYGNFHVWHKSSDLWLLDLQTKELKPLTEANSSDVESYHSWSSNGRWIVFSSRRMDGNYTRPYIAYFDKQGRVHHPFLLPQSATDYYETLFKSFNIPEFMAAPVRVSHKTILDAASKDALPTKYGGRLSQP